MRTYFDSSALVKLLIDEPGRERAQRCWSASTARLTSRLSYVEVRAALAAANRSKRLSDDELNAARGLFDRLWSRMDVAEAAPVLIGRAGNLAEVHALRGYDAVHLASAIAVRDADPVHMLTWDINLSDAAFASAVNVIRTTGA